MSELERIRAGARDLLAELARLEDDVRGLRETFLVESRALRRRGEIACDTMRHGLAQEVGQLATEARTLAGDICTARGEFGSPHWAPVLAKLQGQIEAAETDLARLEGPLRAAVDRPEDVWLYDAMQGDGTR